MNLRPGASLPVLRTAAVAIVATAIMAVGAYGAADGDAALVKLKAQYKRAASIPFPKTNGYSDAKFRLGHALFFDPRVSGPGTVSRATCHNPALGWKDGLPLGVGHDAKQLGRATPTILNLAWADLLMWDGRKNNLEDQATGPIEADVEMNQRMGVLVEKLSGIAGYRRMFGEAFGRDEISKVTIAQAIATFERTLVSNKAPFDQWIEGDESAIGDDAKRGFKTFNAKAKCAACHSGWRFTDDGFHDVGLKSEDVGRAAQVPDEPTLKHAFKTPTLRNIDLGAATQEISRNVQQAAAAAGQVAANIANINHGAAETGSGSIQVLSAAKSLLSDSDHLRLAVDKFVNAIKANEGHGRRIA